MTTTDIAYFVETAADLDELVAALNAAEQKLAQDRVDGVAAPGLDGLEVHFGIDLTSLPTFGAGAPEGRDGIYSWDAERVLETDGHDWFIGPR